MVQRQYQAPNIGVRDTREVQRFQVQGSDNRVVLPRQIGDEGWKDQFLTGIMSNGTRLLEKAGNLSLQNAYMEGAAQAGVAKSEEELQGDALTRDWAVAGYRDTMGKMALADMEASFMTDLPQLREKDPEALQAYLTDRRQKMLPALAGMSAEARAASVGQLALQDRAATRKYTTERAKYIIDMKQQAVTTQWGVAEKAFQQASMGGSDQDRVEALRGMAGILLGSVWGDKSLNDPIRREMTFGAINSAMQKDQVALYEYFSNNELHDERGGFLLSRLEPDQQSRLASAYREAMNRTRDRRNFASNMQIAGLESQIDNDTFQGTGDDLLAILKSKTDRQEIGADKAGAIYNRFLDRKNKAEQAGFLADSYLRGDLQGIFGKGKDEADGAKAMEAQMARAGLGEAERLTTWLTAGKNGMATGYKKAGETLGVAVRQMVDSKTNEVLPQHLRTFQTIMGALQSAEADGQTNTRVNLLSGMNEDDRMFTEQVIRRHTAGASVTEAIQQAKDAQAQDNSMTPSMKAARAQATATAVSNGVDSMESMGFLSSVWNHAKAMFGSTSAASDLTLRPRNSVGDRDGWFSNSETVQFYEGRMRDAVREEAGNVSLLRPNATPEEILNVAKANVAGRTIQTSQGPIFMPRGVNMQTVFGVGAGNTSAIGPAIDSMLKGTVADSRWQVSFTQGQLFAQEYDKAGQRVGQGIFIPGTEVGRKVLEQSNVEFGKAKERFGEGRKVKIGDKEISYNGMSTAGVPAEWMFDFRTSLVQNEGVRDEPYQDLSGNRANGKLIHTVGVGVSSHNKHYPKVGEDGKVAAADIASSFAGASNDAARAGASAALQLNRYTSNGFRLLSELAYQSGEAFMSQRGVTGDKYREFGAAFRGTDVNKAKEAFKSTAAWFYSGESRRNHYLSLIESAMKGN